MGSLVPNWALTRSGNSFWITNFFVFHFFHESHLLLRLVSSKHHKKKWHSPSGSNQGAFQVELFYLYYLWDSQTHSDTSAVLFRCNEQISWPAIPPPLLTAVRSASVNVTQVCYYQLAAPATTSASAIMTQSEFRGETLTHAASRRLNASSDSSV